MLLIHLDAPKPNYAARKRFFQKIAGDNQKAKFRYSDLLLSQFIFISFCFARSCGFGPIFCFLSTVCIDELNDRDIYVDAASYSLQLPIPSKDTENSA